MKIRFLKASLIAVFLTSLASLGAIILFINPFKTTPLTYLLFSVVLFLVLLSVLSWFGVRVRQKFISSENLNRILTISFREAFLFSLLGLGYLWLNHFQILRWWNALLLLIFVLAAEYFFLRALSKNSSKARNF